MSVSITTLSENTAARPGLLAEWGLSILVETEEKKVLLDTGQSISAGHNADTLGIELQRIDKIVLSHGHFDHTGGLVQVLGKAGKEIEVIAHPDIWSAKYSRRQGPERYIGIPFSRKELESLGARFNLTAKPVKITDNIITTGEIPMVTDFERLDTNLFIKENGKFKPDMVTDDQALIIKTEPGLIIILGCAHHGIINTIYLAQQLTGISEIYMVLGGCHLFNASQEQVYLTIAKLKELDVQHIGVSHCTGLPAAAVMAYELGERFFFNNAGTQVNNRLRSLS